MRLLLVGAFPYPHHQGSQIYFREQALALKAAGAEVELLTYASGLEDESTAENRTADFVHHRPPVWTSPRRLSSGPSLGKPMADLALAMTLRQTLASRTGDDAFDAILTHNAEAGLAGLLALSGRSGARVAHVYCVHTLLGEELSAYVKSWKPKGFSASKPRHPTLRRLLDAFGRGLDRFLARRVDAWIALTHSAQRVMRQSSVGPGQRIAPPIPDPRDEPDRRDPSATAYHHDLEPGGFYLYSGNLDGYQELGTLEAAAALLVQAVDDPSRRPVLVVASHDAEAVRQIAEMEGLRFCHVPEPAEMQALISAATASLLMRQAEGGYPIKLANAHAAGTPSIAFHAREWGLQDGQNALVASTDRPAATLAGSILKLAGDPDLVERLGRGARRLYESQHRPADVALRTLALVQQTLDARPERPDPPAPARPDQSPPPLPDTRPLRSDRTRTPPSAR